MPYLCSNLVPGHDIEGVMLLVPTQQVTVLTGLSTAKLREWTSRRALIPADVPPKSKGCPAQYSWQTVLILRIAVTLRDRFHIELQAHRPLYASLRCSLHSKSFVALWDKVLVVHGVDNWSLIDVKAIEPLSGDAVIIQLNPHLIVLSKRFALPELARANGQLELFPALPLDKLQAPAHALRPLMGYVEELQHESA